MAEYKEREALPSVFESEKYRVARRNEQLLAQELEWVTSQPKFNTSSFRNLDAYCRWLSSTQPKAVKWDLLRHYAIQKDAPYFPEFQRNHGIVCKPFCQDYTNRLLTHSLCGSYWEQAKSDGYLSRGLSKVCFSSGQVVFKGNVFDGMNSMTGIFDREILDQVYTLMPYSDHEVEWEREIRAHEPISVNLALSWIPTREFVFEFNHWGQLTCVCGTKMIVEMENHYLRTGKLPEIK